MQILGGNRKHVHEQACFTADLGLASNNNTAPSITDGTYFRIMYKKYLSALEEIFFFRIERNPKGNSKIMISFFLLPCNQFLMSMLGFSVSLWFKSS